MAVVNEFLRSKMNNNKPKSHHPSVTEWLGEVHEPILSSLTHYAMLAGAYLALYPNKSRTGIKCSLAFGDAKIGEWCNSAEEMNELITDYLDICVEECRLQGLIQGPPNGGNGRE